MRTGLQVWDSFNLATAATEQFDCVVILGFEVASNVVTGSKPESLTITGKWPAVPVVFFGNTAAIAGKWNSSTTCSTGVKSLGSAYSTVRRGYVAYPVGSARRWKAMSINLHPTVPLGENVGTTFRRVVCLNYSSTVGGGIPGNATITRNDADSTGFTSAGNDSVVLWTRTMIAAADGGPAAATAPKPIIFCDSGAGVAQDLGLMAMAMQMADSASGGRVWDKAGARPIKIGFGVTASASRGYYVKDLSANLATGTWTHLEGGAFCQSDSCDTSTVLGGLDSLGTLSGLKTTFYVDPCSLSTYPSVKNWFLRAGDYHVGMQTKAGAVGTGTTAIMGASSATHPADAFGRQRTRIAALPWGGVSPAADTLGDCTAASDTMLTYCNIRWGMNLIRGYFGDGRLDHSVLPAFGDWSPAAYTRLGGGPGRDSVAYAIWRAGVRAIVFRPEFINNNPNVSGVVSSGTLTYYPSGGVAPATDPFGYGPDAGNIPIYADPATPGRVIGRLKLIAERGQAPAANWNSGYTGHDNKSEWFEGLVQDRWYYTLIRYYYHNFLTRTPVITISMGQLGGSATATSARQGWYVIKHIANEVTAANNLGWVDRNGNQRRAFEFDYIENIEP
jgi:hypothetical protein